MKVERIRARALAVPMKRPLPTSIATLNEAALLLVDLQTDQGIVGRAYLFALGRQNLAPIARLVEAMAAMVQGDAVAPFELERKLRARFGMAWNEEAVRRHLL